MGLLTALITLPVSGPISGTLWLARKLGEAAEAERDNPAAIKRALTELENQLDEGLIDEETFEEAEEILLDRLEGQGRT